MVQKRTAAEKKDAAKATKQKRDLSAAKQTPIATEDIPKIPGWELHHILGLDMLEPFFDGLETAEEIEELQEYILELNRESGNTLGNYEALLSKYHQGGAHRELRHAGIEVDKADWGESNFIHNQRTGEIEDFVTARSLAYEDNTRQIRKRPNLSKLNMKDRKFALKEYIDLVGQHAEGVAQKYKNLSLENATPEQLEALERWKSPVNPETGIPWEPKLTDQQDLAIEEAYKEAERGNGYKKDGKATLESELSINGHKENGNGNGHNGNGNGHNGNGKNGNGHGFNLDTKVGGLRTTDQLLNLGTSVATGDVVGATISGGTLAIGQTLKNPTVQKKVASQVAELVAKRGAKTAAKLIPGLDIYLSGRETMGYLGQGRLGQAGIAALSGAVGWIPGIGDAASAALDITNTGIDIARLQPQSRGGDNKKNRFNRRTTASLASLNSINLK